MLSGMNWNDDAAVRRWLTGLLAIVFLIAGFAGWWWTGSVAQPGKVVWPAMCLRIAMVLGALWLCLPTRTRKTSWSGLTPMLLGGIIVVAALSDRMKPVLPWVAAAGVMGWLLGRRRR
jgi:hypothetical protein